MSPVVHLEIKEKKKQRKKQNAVLPRKFTKAHFWGS
jgi:hypothetical protein